MTEISYPVKIRFLSFTCEDITVVMATSFSANQIYKRFMPYCYNIQKAHKRYYHSRYFIRCFNWLRDHYVTANKCLRIIVCSCVLRCEVVLLQIILLVRSLVTGSEDTAAK